MTIYDHEQGMQSILDAALGEYLFRGFRLIELNDYILMLYYRDELVDVFSQGRRTTIIVAQAACQKHLEAPSAS